LILTHKRLTDGMLSGKNRICAEEDHARERGKIANSAVASAQLSVDPGILVSVPREWLNMALQGYSKTKASFRFQNEAFSSMSA
jgi:uncharacterized protein YdhG (YjbR/CyaY superfamily)